MVKLKIRLTFEYNKWLFIVFGGIFTLGVLSPFEAYIKFSKNKDRKTSGLE